MMASNFVKNNFLEYGNNNITQLTLHTYNFTNKFEVSNFKTLLYHYNGEDNDYNYLKIL